MPLSLRNCRDSWRNTCRNEIDCESKPIDHRSFGTELISMVIVQERASVGIRWFLPRHTGGHCGGRAHSTVRKRKKFDGLEGAKYFFPVERGKFFLALLYYCRSSPLYPVIRRYVESFIFYLNFPIPTPHFESCKVVKCALTCVKKTGPNDFIWQKELSHYHREKLFATPGLLTFFFDHCNICDVNAAYKICLVFYFLTLCCLIQGILLMGKLLMMLRLVLFSCFIWQSSCIINFTGHSLTKYHRSF